MKTAIKAIGLILTAALLLTFTAAIHAQTFAPGCDGPTACAPTAKPLSAIAVSQCGLAVALFIQLDATHLLRADPRQSDMFTAVDGKMVQANTGPMPWSQAYKLAQSAVLTTHVVLPCSTDQST